MEPARAESTDLEVTENEEEIDETSGEASEIEGVKLPLEQHPGVVEALLFVHSEPISARKIAMLSELSLDEVHGAIAILLKRYGTADSGFELCEVAEKFQLRTKAEFAKYVRALTAAKPKRLSAAALETLAIVAYQQPIVKSEIERIRGVDTSPTLKTLLEKRLIKIIGHQATVGQPALYGTTEDFLKIFGLKGLPELPSLREVAAVDGDPGEVDEEEDPS